MTKKRIVYVVLIALIVGIWSLTSCKKDDTAGGTDKELYDMSKSSFGFIWYKNADSLFERSSGSGHAQPFLKTRYNSIAAAKLDVDGKVIDGVIFPEGSLIVKELYEDSTSIVRYAILYKKPNNPDADDKGWVWGYINADGTVAEPASNKGSACISCHLQSENIDYTLMNKFFP